MSLDGEQDAPVLLAELLRGSSIAVWDSRRDELRPQTSQPFAILALLVSRRLGDRGAEVTSSEIIQTLHIPSPTKQMGRLKNWNEQAFENLAGGGEAQYVCKLDAAAVDILSVDLLVRSLLESGESPDFTQVRQVLDKYRDPTAAFGNHLRKDTGVADPFQPFKERIQSLFQLACDIAPSSDMANAIERKYHQVFDGRPLLRNGPIVKPRESKSRRASEAADMLSAMAEVGIEDVLADLGGTYLDPELLLDHAGVSFDFLGHTASKLRRSSNFPTFLKSVRPGKGGERPVRLLLSGQSLASRPADLKSIVQTSRTYSKVLEVRLYESATRLRLTVVDDSWLAIQTYPDDEVIPGENYERGAIILGPHGSETFYHAFRGIFNDMWHTANKLPGSLT